MANGRRTMWVAIGDDFICPVCNGSLLPPPVEAAPRLAVARAAFTSVAVAIVAGLFTYGMVETVHSLSRSKGPTEIALAARNLPAVPPVMAPAALTTPPTVSVAAAGPAPVQVATGTPSPSAPSPIAPSQEAKLAGSLPMGSRQVPRPSVVAAAAPTLPPASVRRFATLPISFGTPVGPESDAPVPVTHWHHHRIPGGLWSVPTSTAQDDVAVWGPAERDAAAEVTQPLSVEQGDAGLPADTAEPALPAGTEEGLPATALAEAKPPVAREIDVGSMPPIDPATVLASLTRYVPAARVDPATLVAPEKEGSLVASLKVPTYPPVMEAADLPGRVEVGCVINECGRPTHCRLQRESNPRFGASVLAWLSGGDVRYRPGLAGGHIVPEPRNYHVRFEP